MDALYTDNGGGIITVIPVCPWRYAVRSTGTRFLRCLVPQYAKVKDVADHPLIIAVVEFHESVGSHLVDGPVEHVGLQCVDPITEAKRGIGNTHRGTGSWLFDAILIHCNRNEMK